MPQHDIDLGIMISGVKLNASCRWWMECVCWCARRKDPWHKPSSCCRRLSNRNCDPSSSSTRWTGPVLGLRRWSRKSSTCFVSWRCPMNCSIIRCFIVRVRRVGWRRAWRGRSLVPRRFWRESYRTSHHPRSVRTQTSRCWCRSRRVIPTSGSCWLGRSCRARWKWMIAWMPSTRTARWWRIVRCSRYCDGMACNKSRWRERWQATSSK